MNPLPIAVLLLISQGQGGINGRGRRGRGAGGLLSAGADFDVAPVLDGLYRTANALERIDKMNKLARLPMTRERAPELLEAIGAPPEVKNLIQAGSPLMARGAQGANGLSGYGNAAGLGETAGYGNTDFQAPRALPQGGQYDMYDDRDPYVTGAYDNGARGSAPVYGAQNTTQMPDFAQLMQTFGPMLKTFMQQNNG